MSTTQDPRTLDEILAERQDELKDLRRRLTLAVSAGGTKTMRFSEIDLVRLKNAVFKLYDPEVEREQAFIREAAAALRAPEEPLPTQGVILSYLEIMFERGFSAAKQSGDESHGPSWDSYVEEHDGDRLVNEVTRRAALYRGAPPETLRAEPDGWRSMDSAPMDGTGLLLWVEGSLYIGCWVQMPEPFGSFWDIGDRELHNPDEQPTHWMPAPKGPSRGAPERGTEPG